MSRFAENHDAPEIQDTFADICKTLNIEKPTALFSSMSVRPDLATPTWQLMKNLVGSGQLPPSVKQMMMMVISSQADCRYCAVSHQNALESMGMEHTVVESCLSDLHNADLPELHRQIALFASRAARSPNAVTDQDIEKLRDLGLDDPDIVEICITTALTRFLNTWADASGIPPANPINGDSLREAS